MSRILHRTKTWGQPTSSSVRQKSPSGTLWKFPQMQILSCHGRVHLAHHPFAETHFRYASYHFLNGDTINLSLSGDSKQSFGYMLSIASNAASS